MNTVDIILKIILLAQIFTLIRVIWRRIKHGKNGLTAHLLVVSLALFAFVFVHLAYRIILVSGYMYDNVLIEIVKAVDLAVTTSMILTNSFLHFSLYQKRRSSRQFNGTRIPHFNNQRSKQ